MPSSILHVVPRDGGEAVALPVIDIPLPPHWSAIARAKGYEIAGRVRDRLHLALRCTRYDAVSLAKVFTLRSAQPRCPHCLRTARTDAAADAGAEFRRRDPEDTRCAFYTLPCGHEVRRQFGLITPARPPARPASAARSAMRSAWTKRPGGEAGPCTVPTQRVINVIASTPMPQEAAAMSSGSRGLT